MRFDEMPEIVTCFMFLWILVIFILGICNILRAVQMKRTRHIVVSAVVLLAMYFLMQVMSDILHRNAGLENVKISYMLGRMSIIWWVLLIIIIMGISITLASFFKNWKTEHITPMSVKDSIDMLHAGICYWEDGGRVILSNKKMDEICMDITGETLMNAEEFFDAIESDGVMMPDGSIKYFFHNMVDFDDKQIHELVAADVTELYKKNELLEEKTRSVQKMNENLRRYNRNLEEMVHKKEILEAKVYIHDEMNRLMLLTTAMTDTVIPEVEFHSVMTLWRNNAVLLGNEAEKSRADIDMSEINKLADLLGLELTWTGEKTHVVPERLREVFVMSTGEAIANAVKHADAKHIMINMENIDGKLIITISNDGHKPDKEVKPGGGLSNIERMVKEHRGDLDIMIKEYFSLIIKLPL